MLMTQTSEKHKNIPPDLMARYVAREMTSKELAKATGYHEVYLRRSIKRDPRVSTKIGGKAQLIAAREAMRKQLAHLPVSEIAKAACVSQSTAARIKKKYKESK